MRSDARIGVLTTSYPRWVGETLEPAGSFVATLTRLLEAQGHRVDVLAPAAREGRPAGGARWVRYAPRSLERTFYGAGAAATLRRDPAAWLGALTYPPALLRAARRASARWDAVIAHWAIPAGLVARMAAPELPRLVVVHGGDLRLLETLPGGAGLARAALADAGVWTVSREQAGRLERLVGRRPELVAPMPAEPPPARVRAEARARLGVRGPLVLALGRLVRLKGHDVLVDAAAGLGVTLLIGGEGPERRALAARAARLGVDLRLPGVLGGDAKADAFAAADAFAQPSRVEGSPVAVREAWLAGLPVVATRVGGLPEQVGATGAWLVPPEDPAALRVALARALEAGPRPRPSPPDESRLGEQVLALLRDRRAPQGRTRRVPAGGS